MSLIAMENRLAVSPAREVVCIVKRWEHHSDSGGYDRLAEAVGGTVVRRRSRKTWRRSVEEFLWWRFPRSRSHLIDYQYVDWFAEASVLARSWVRRTDVVHVLYGDEQLDLLLRRRRWLRAPLVASFHVPTPRVWDRFETVQKDLLPGLDAAVVVSRCQVPDFTRWLGEDRVFYVPHGIDTDCFHPPETRTSQARLRLLTVGEHMRDFTTLAAVIGACHASALPVQFEIVGAGPRFPDDLATANVTLHPRLSEAELRQLYGEADAVLLPVLDATANNSVLESLACGTPVISNRLGGMPDYLDDSCSWLFPPQEVEGIVHLVGELCADRSEAEGRRDSARRKAMQFAWASVARQMQDVYATVMRRSARPALAASNLL